MCGVASVNAAGFCACERSAIFVALRCTSGAGANRDRQGGTGNQGRGRGDKKANGISAANPHPVVKGERHPVGGRAIHQTHTRRRKHRKPFAGARCTHRAAKKTGTVRRKPAIPPHRAPTQPPGPAANRHMRNKKLRKNREMQQKRRILRQSCALCAQRIINARSKYIKVTAAKKKISNKLYKGFEHIV